MPRPVNALVKFHGCGRVQQPAREVAMVSYFVRYRGEAADPRAFARYYENEHAQILSRFPGIRSLIVHQPMRWNDPFPVHPDGTELLAQMTFDSAADLDEALMSDARREARADFARFPPFAGEVTHQAMSAKVIF
jgi:uncharacterized protein (TIGR02118 family)